MTERDLHLITGAFGYSGQHLARRLLGQGKRVATITGHPDRPNPFGDAVRAHRMDFDDPAGLRRAMEGVEVFYNTYWVRFAYGDTTHQRAVQNTQKLIDAAVDAGVERFVHVSITNPSIDSTLPYFRGKAELEKALAASGLSHAILRPAVLFGGRDVLLNNIAWLLRRLPVFGVAGKGDYGIQPIHVEDLAALQVEHGSHRENVTLDAVGPETFRFEELVRLIAKKIGSRACVCHVPKPVLFLTARVMGRIVGDVVLTWDEIAGLSANLLVSHDPPTGETKLSEWLERHANELGREYANEVSRHYR